jgi:polyribonucleotide nucleotidyltransferase
MKPSKNQQTMSQLGFNHTFDMGDGRTISIETGKLAKQADGSVVLRMGDCVILATACASKEPKPGQGFFPLSVDYQEKFYANGRIPGSFPRRETRLSDYEVLISRLVDRTLRPLFPESYLCDTQIQIWLLSADKEVMSDALVGLAASAALTVSDIPFQGPISEVRVAKIDGVYKVNPGRTEIERATLDIIIGASKENIMMVEGEMKEVSEAELIEAIRIGHEAIKIQCDAQLALCQLMGGKKAIRAVAPFAENEELKKQITEACEAKIYGVAKSGVGKHERSSALAAIAEEFVTNMGDALTDDLKPLFKRYYHDLEYDVIRGMVVNDRVRLDGRKLDQVRPLWMEINTLPSPHGSAIFTRGETQALATVTLGGKDDEQMIDLAHSLDFDNFLLHYNFPGFSTGEVKPNRAPARREIGHGNLAKRSLLMVVPEDCPYTIRVVSDVLESNGSSSMATVCAASLALMDAGIQITGGVSGIAMGMITGENGKYAVLSDILGDEDHLGDMDFKVTGTQKGICGVQMDIKVDGLSFEVLNEALEQAKAGRLHILSQMNTVIATANADYKPHAPRIEKVYIDKEFIGAVIGPGGKNIQELQRTTMTQISIEEVGDKGEVTILAINREGLDKALASIKSSTYKATVGDEFDSVVKSIKEFGAFVEFLPGKEGLLHISEISHQRLATMDGVFKTGDKVRIKIVGIDPKTGKPRLSSKVLLAKPNEA